MNRLVATGSSDQCIRQGDDFLCLIGLYVNCTIDFGKREIICADFAKKIT